VEGTENWSRDAITRSLEDSLRRLKTDRVDLFFLHSCDLDHLKSEETLRALDDLVAAGKTRFVGYSGENEELDWALASGRFSAVETSVNICDQGNLYGRLKAAADSGLGIIAKRPLANVFWQYDQRPVGQYAEEYWVRWQQMSGLGLEGFPSEASHQDLLRIAWGFVAGVPDISTAIIGTANGKNFKANLKLAGRKRLISAAEGKALKRAWEDASLGGWRGQI
jgi:aryl-alcohol dehydrogenase-like predicted oxidoreductase